VQAPRDVAFLDLGRQHKDLRSSLDGALERTLAGGRLVLGPAVEEFEHDFAEWCGAHAAVGVGSGTDAIALALEAVGIGPGDEVIAPANTCVPTIAGIEGASATPVLADVDRDTLTLDPESVERVLTGKTRAVLAVHLYGQPADMDSIGKIAANNGLKVVEDAAQAHGTAIGGRKAGTLGDAAAFSFYPTKNLGALGDGGAVVTNRADVAEQVRMLRNYGTQQRDYAVVPGRNSRLDELQAAILSAKLPHLDGWNERRRALAERYLEDLGSANVGLPTVPEGGDHAWHLFVIRSRSREPFRTSLAEKGVQTLVHYPRPIHHHPAYAHLAPADGLPVSEEACEEVVSLPLYPELTDEEQLRVIDGVRAAAQ
jgi:dTDP-4-amino-4,6-dideoxygalactose transaminase